MCVSRLRRFPLFIIFTSLFSLDERVLFPFWLHLLFFFCILVYFSVPQAACVLKLGREFFSLLSLRAIPRSFRGSPPLPPLSSLPQDFFFSPSLFRQSFGVSNIKVRILLSPAVYAPISEDRRSFCFSVFSPYVLQYGTDVPDLSFTLLISGEGFSMTRFFLISCLSFCPFFEFLGLSRRITKPCLSLQHNFPEFPPSPWPKDEPERVVAAPDELAGVPPRPESRSLFPRVPFFL